jgi:integrase
MARRTFKNDRGLRTLKPAKPGQRYEVYDAMMPGLVVRVTERGTRTFALVARFPGSSNPTRRALGEYGAIGLAEARTRARDWIALLERGVDPQRETERQRLVEQRKQADSFLAIAEKFFATKLKAQRRGYAVERVIRKELLPPWGKRPVADISHRDVRHVIESVIERGAETYAHNVLDAAHAVFNFALGRDVIEHNPCKRLSRRALIGNKRHRERTLTDVELRSLWRASGRLGYPFGPLYRLLLLTGARLEEVAGARWCEFDLDNKLWSIPAERFKSGTEHAVPLSDAARTVLEGLPRFRTGDFLFSATSGASPVNGLGKAKTRLDSRMLRTLRALARQRGEDNPHNVKLDHFVNHDIRRTVRTRLSALKVQDHIAEMVIGHGRKGLARIYDQHRYIDEKREALSLWAARLRSIVEPPPANVVPLAKARA